VPDNYAGNSFYAIAGWTVGINTASAHKEEARLFADFLAEKAPFLSEKTGAIPGAGVPLGSLDPFHSKLWDIVIAAEPAQDFAGLPWTELEKIFREELSSLFEGKSSPADTAATIQSKWESLLKP
jgi:ABC-type glycerol-3-phosphate transport system substrate-binding protein